MQQSTPPKVFPISMEDVKLYYSRDDIIESIFELCENREISPVFTVNNSQMHGKRPNAINFPAEISHFAKMGATSFHSSVELWKNPLNLSSSLKPHEMDNMRLGWDFILDIDSNAGIDYAREAALILIKRLKDDFDVKNVSLKFSGSRGFHLGMPYRMLPREIDNIETKKRYPALPRNIVMFLREFVRSDLSECFLRLDKKKDKSAETQDMPKDAGKAKQDKVIKEYDPFQYIDIEQNWGSRHLFRMPYSFNEKTWLVSKPLSVSEIHDFRFEDALPSKVKGKGGFLDKGDEGELKYLVTAASDWAAQIEERENRDKYAHSGMKSYLNTSSLVPKEYFPPCITNILKGLRDGRKRSVFILINFLYSSGWSFEMIKEELYKWNRNNPDPLKDVYITTQFNYAMKKGEKIPPPNCDNKGYYKDIAVCIPDNFCARIKNPAMYAIKKFENISYANSPGRRRKKANAGKKDDKVPEEDDE